MIPFLVIDAARRASERKFHLAEEDAKNIGKYIIEEREKSWSPIFQAVPHLSNIP